MLFDIFDHRPQPVAFVLAGAFSMDLATGAFKRAGLRTIGGPEEQLPPGVHSQPLLYRLGFVTLIIINHARELSKARRRRRVVKRLEEVQKQAGGFPPPDPGQDRSRAHIPSPGEVTFLVGPRGEDFLSGVGI